MLSKPNYGWTTFSLPGMEEYKLSDVDDLPINWLEDAIHGLENKRAFCVSGNMESEELYCVTDFYGSFIVIGEDDCGIQSQENIVKMEFPSVTAKDFCRMLCEDLRANIDEWASFSDYYGDNRDERKVLIIERIEKLEKILREL